MNIKELNEAIDKALKEDYKELQNDKSLDVYRKILNGSVKIDDYVFQDKKHVLVKFHNVVPQDRKQVIILDDKFEERLNKAYDKCIKVNESLKQTKSDKKSVNESYVVKEKDDCPIYNTVGCEECDMAAEGLCLIGTDIREFKQDNQNESAIDKKNIKEEMEYNKKIWDIFEENIAEYLKEQGVTFDNAAEYIAKNGKEIIKAVLEKEYDYEEDDQAIFELYYNCPINFTDKAQAIDKLLEEYLAESLKRCLTLTDKLR